jgi:DNA-binding transcriptional LysR family regulator
VDRGNCAGHRIVYRADSLRALQAAARGGMGVAALPCYLGDPDPELAEQRQLIEGHRCND